MLPRQQPHLLEQFYPSPSAVLTAKFCTGTGMFRLSCSPTLRRMTSDDVFEKFEIQDQLEVRIHSYHQDQGVRKLQITLQQHSTWKEIRKVKNVTLHVHAM